MKATVQLRKKAERLSSLYTTNRFTYSVAYTGILAAIICLLIMMPSLIRFNGVFIIRGDFVDQYIARVIVSKRMLFSGDLSFNWSNFLGSPYTGWSSFLSFNTPCLFFPEEAIPYVLTFCHMLRFACAAMTMHMYLYRMIQKKKNMVVGGILYAFSSFSIVNIEFMQFMDVVAVFPLLLAAIEDMFRKEKYRHTLIFASFINCYMSFYFFIGTSVIFFVYAVIRFWKGPEWGKKRHAYMIINAITEYLLGIFLSGIVTIPFIYKMLSTSRASTTVGDTNSWGIYLSQQEKALSGSDYWLAVFSRVGNKFSIMFEKLTALFTMGASNRFSSYFAYAQWKSYAVMPPLFGCVFAFAFFIRNKKHWLKNFFAVLLVISLLPFLNNALILYSESYTRWWYILAAAIVLMTVYVLERPEEYMGDPMKKSLRINVGAFSIIAVVHIAVMLAVSYLGEDIKKYDPHLFLSRFFALVGNVKQADVISRVILVSLVVTAAFFAVTYAFIRFAALRKYVLPLVSCAAVVYGAFYTVANNTSRYLFDHIAYSSVLTLDEAVDIMYTQEKLTLPDEGFYRVDTPTELNNFAWSHGVSSISTFDSAVGSAAAEFAAYAVMTSDVSSVRFRPCTNDNALRAFLSVKYYYDYSPEKHSINIPLRFASLGEYKDGILYENQNYIPMGFAYTQYITESELYTGVRNGEIPERNIKLLLKAMVIPDEYEEKVQGLLTKCTDYEADLTEVSDERRSEACSTFYADTGGFQAEITLEQERYVFFSVPYEAHGWTARVNGEPAEIMKSNIGFMAVKVPAGTSQIEFSYRHPALNIGIFVSCTGAVLITAWIFYNRKKERQEK